MHFEGLPFGRRWLLTIDHSFLVHRVTLVGPVTADAVAVDVSIPARCFELVARLVRSDHLPAAGASVTVHRVGQLPWGCKFTSASNGRVRLGLWCVPVAIYRVTPLEITIQGDQCTTRRLVVDRVIEPGKTDLGDIVVEPPAGETLLARVEVRCDGKPANRPWARLLVRQDVVWRIMQTAVRHDAAGIEFRGMAPPAPMAVSCAADGCVPIENVPLQVGEHKVVDLQRGANFEVAVLATGLPRNAVTGVVVCEGDQRQIQDYLDDAQVFRFHQVVPGRYRLRINIDDRVVYETAGIERAFDRHHEHAAERLLPSGARLRLVPGTIVEFTALRNGKPGASERVVVGTTSPQIVQLR